MTTIKLRHSTTTGNAPSSLVVGEVAINETDKRLFHRDSGGNVVSVELAGEVSRNLIPWEVLADALKGTTTVAAGVWIEVPGLRGRFWIANNTDQDATLSIIDGPLPGTKAVRFSFVSAPTTGGIEWIWVGEGQPELLAGRKATHSIYVRANQVANLVAQWVQMFGDGGSANVYTSIHNSNTAGSGAWERHADTFTVPSISGKTIGTQAPLEGTIDCTLSPRHATTYDIGCWQIQEGSISDYLSRPLSDLWDRLPVPGNHNLLSNRTASRGGSPTAITITSGQVVGFEGWQYWNASNQTATMTVVDGPIAGTKALQFAWSVAPTTGSLHFYNNVPYGRDNLRTLAGRIATGGFYFKSSNGSNNYCALIQNFGDGGSTEVSTDLFNVGHTGSANWVRRSATVWVPTIGGKTIGNGPYFQFYGNFVPRNTGNYVVGCFSLEEGPLTDFQTRPKWQDQLLSTKKMFLQDDTIFYVRTDGSDKNDGLSDSSSGAWLTPTYAAEMMPNVDAQGHDVTIQFSSGVWSTLDEENGLFTIKAGPANCGVLTIRGDPTTPGNVELRVTGTPTENWAYIFNIGDVKATGFNIDGFRVSSTSDLASNWICGFGVWGNVTFRNIEVGSMSDLSDFGSHIAVGLQNFTYLSGSTYYNNGWCISGRKGMSLAFFGTQNIAGATTSPGPFIGASNPSSIEIDSNATLSGQANWDGIPYNISNFAVLNTSGKTMIGNGSPIRSRCVVDNTWYP